MATGWFPPICFTWNNASPSALIFLLFFSIGGIFPDICSNQGFEVMGIFRKKPIEIEAWRVDEVLDAPEWLMQAMEMGTVWRQGGDAPYYTIETLEGEMRANTGDWIIRDAQGELYPCKPDIFEQTYDQVRQPNLESTKAALAKTLHNFDISGARENVKDIQVVGNGDMFQLLCKASSEAEGWMKSTKAMDLAHGCLVQVTTQQRNSDGSYAVAEALTYVPGVWITGDENGGRKLLPINGTG